MPIFSTSNGFTIGKYNGCQWKRLRLCDVFSVPSKREAYFLFDNGEPTGDNFPTLSALAEYIDSLPMVVDA